jgi:hypothetical protein
VLPFAPSFSLDDLSREIATSVIIDQEVLVAENKVQHDMNVTAISCFANTPMKISICVVNISILFFNISPIGSIRYTANEKVSRIELDRISLYYR